MMPRILDGKRQAFARGRGPQCARHGGATPDADVRSTALEGGLELTLRHRSKGGARPLVRLRVYRSRRVRVRRSATIKRVVASDQWLRIDA